MEISKIMLGELTASLAEKNIRFTYDESVPAYLAHKSFSLRFGARNLRRLIEKDIEDTLARTIIESGSESISGAHITVQDNKIQAQII